MLRGEEFESYSAGVKPTTLNSRAVQVMKEAGIDISKQKPKHVDELKGESFDYIVTVCGNADQRCPTFPGKGIRVHFAFDDPPELAKTAKSEDEALAHYRRVRDEICTFVEHMPETLEQNRK